MYLPRLRTSTLSLSFNRLVKLLQPGQLLPLTQRPAVATHQKVSPRFLRRSGQRWYSESLTLALPFPVKILGTSSPHISLDIRDSIQLGPYTYHVFADLLCVHGTSWNQGIFYRVDRAIESRKIHFSWFTGPYYWGHKAFRIAAMFDEAEPGIFKERFPILRVISPPGTPYP